jgi:hypothetical protein
VTHGVYEGGLSTHVERREVSLSPKEDRGMTGFIWLRIGTSGGLS